jgi:hypothetical protein
MRTKFQVILAALFFLGGSVACSEEPQKTEVEQEKEGLVAEADETETDEIGAADSLLFFYAGSHREYFTHRKDRVIVKTASKDDAQALSERVTFRTGYGVLSVIEIDSATMSLDDVQALPGVLDATYGLQYSDGTMQYVTDQIFVQPRTELSIQQVLKEVGLSENVATIKLFNEDRGTYLITLDVKLGTILRRCRQLYESGMCVYAEPNFIRETKVF